MPTLVTAYCNRCAAASDSRVRVGFPWEPSAGTPRQDRRRPQTGARCAPCRDGLSRGSRRRGTPRNAPDRLRRRSNTPGPAVALASPIVPGAPAAGSSELARDCARGGARPYNLSEYRPFSPREKSIRGLGDFKDRGGAAGWRKCRVRKGIAAPGPRRATAGRGPCAAPGGRRDPDPAPPDTRLRQAGVAGEPLRRCEGPAHGLPPLDAPLRVGCSQF